MNRPVVVTTLYKVNVVHWLYPIWHAQGMPEERLISRKLDSYIHGGVTVVGWKSAAHSAVLCGRSWWLILLLHPAMLGWEDEIQNRSCRSRAARFACRSTSRRRGRASCAGRSRVRGDRALLG